MFVIEVRPARAWRGLRMVGTGELLLFATKEHGRASHWFAKTTVEQLLRDGCLRVGGTVKPLAQCPKDRIAVRECSCDPTSLGR